MEGRDKRDLLSIIQYNIRDINDSFRGLDVDEMVPCTCDECRGSWNEGKPPWYFRLRDLKRRLEKNQKTVECENSYDDMDIHELLGYSVVVVVEEKTPEIHYYEGGHMEIRKQVIKGEHARVFNAEEMKYIEHAGLSKEELQQIVEAVLKLMDKERELLKEYYERLEQLQSDSDKQKMTRKIRTFLVNSGIAIAQSLTAAGIYDLGKMLFR